MYGLPHREKSLNSGGWDDETCTDVRYVRNREIRIILYNSVPNLGSIYVRARHVSPEVAQIVTRSHQERKWQSFRSHAVVEDEQLLSNPMLGRSAVE